MASLELKRGDSLVLDCTARESVRGPAIDLSGWTIRSQIRDRRDALLADLSAAILDAAAGSFRLTGPATSTWAPGSYRMDIEYTDPGGRVVSTETLEVRVIEDVTR
ncbi:MAG TPA: hypothetical protein VNL74_03955 [Methylococcus sp.]|nr:hypothetical protein [Methylococcus sp.]